MALHSPTWSHMPPHVAVHGWCLGHMDHMQPLTVTSRKASPGPRQLECSSAHRTSCFSPGAGMRLTLLAAMCCGNWEYPRTSGRSLGLVGTLSPSCFHDPRGSYIISIFQVENQDLKIALKGKQKWEICQTEKQRQPTRDVP